MKKTIIPIRVGLISASAFFTLLTYTDRICLSTAKDSIMSDIGLSMTQFGWVMAFFTLGYGLFQPLLGRVADNYGPRKVFTIIVGCWTFFTVMTGLAWNFASMLFIRFFLGGGESGTYPTLSKVTLNWYPIKERGIVQGINFSGSRIGGAIALSLSAWLIHLVGWRNTFFVYGSIGVLYGILWYLLFRDKPEESRFVSDSEKDFIINNRQQIKPNAEKLSFSAILKSKNMKWVMMQYVSSCFIFFFTLTWMYPYIREKFSIDPINAGFYTSVPLLAGTLGNWVSGMSVDFLYKKYSLNVSRRVPAIVGFLLAAFGMFMVIHSNTVFASVFFLAVAVFGADATLSPSWAFCIDIGKQSSGTVSSLMNMAGNFGAVITSVSYPYLFQLTGSNEPFFYICMVLAIIAIFSWLKMDATNSISNT